MASNRRFMEAWARKDTAALASLYTDDCKLMPTGSDIVYKDGLLSADFVVIS